MVSEGYVFLVSMKKRKVLFLTELIFLPLDTFQEILFERESRRKYPKSRHKEAAIDIFDTTLTPIFVRYVLR